MRLIENRLSRLDDRERQHLPSDLTPLLRNFLVKLAAVLGDRNESEDALLAAEERLGVAFDRLIDGMRRCRIKRAV